MERRRIHLVLEQERLRPHEVPGRQAGDGGDDDVDNRGRNTGGGGRVGLWWLPLAVRARLPLDRRELAFPFQPDADLYRFLKCPVCGRSQPCQLSTLETRLGLENGRDCCRLENGRGRG
jgi:hypothetical protein